MTTEKPKEKSKKEKERENLTQITRVFYICLQGRVRNGVVVVIAMIRAMGVSSREE